MPSSEAGPVGGLPGGTLYWKSFSAKMGFPLLKDQVPAQQPGLHSLWSLPFYPPSWLMHHWLCFGHKLSVIQQILPEHLLYARGYAQLLGGWALSHSLPCCSSPCLRALFPSTVQLTLPLLFKMTCFRSIPWPFRLDLDSLVEFFSNTFYPALLPLT